jgi:hypothetical protein
LPPLLSRLGIGNHWRWLDWVDQRPGVVRSKPARVRHASDLCFETFCESHRSNFD